MNKKREVIHSHGPFKIYADCEEYWRSGVFTEHGHAYISSLLTALEAAKDFALGTLFETYNSAWTDEDHLTLDKLQFCANLQLEEIRILDTPSAATLYFSDSDMFGGHYIAVQFTNTSPVHVELIG